MIFVTGDIHADIDIGKLNTRRFPEQKDMTKNDFLLICGDFGLVWDESPREMHWLKWLQDKPFTTIFCDGNHENFDLLFNDEYFPVQERFGGQVREVAPSVYHAERGTVLTLDGKKVFFMGGASSHDKEYRTEGVSWWPQEIPSMGEMERGIDALDANEWKVDYVITHCAPKDVQNKIKTWYTNDSIVSFLERVRADLDFKTWYFGHYHEDMTIPYPNNTFECLYQRIIKVC